MNTRALITTLALSLLAGNALAANVESSAARKPVGSLTAVQVNAGRATQGADAQDYTGVAAQPSAAAIAAVPVWTTAAAHDYTGVVASASELAVRAITSWNSTDAHDYTGVIGSL